MSIPLSQTSYGVGGGSAPSPQAPPASSSCDKCTDVAPDAVYTCAQQQSWGKCSNSWMAGYCNKSCGRCTC